MLRRVSLNARSTNNQWAAFWKKADLDVIQSHLLHKIHFGQYHTSPAVVGWLGDEDCYLCTKRSQVAALIHLCHSSCSCRYIYVNHIYWGTGDGVGGLTACHFYIHSLVAIKVSRHKLLLANLASIACVWRCDTLVHTQTLSDWYQQTSCATED